MRFEQFRSIDYGSMHDHYARIYMLLGEQFHELF